MKCIFCEIFEKKKSAEIIFKNDLVMAFLDIYPSELGHVLVIPKSHHVRFMDVPIEQAQEMFRVAQSILKAQTAAGFGKGAKIKINDGPEGGQHVPHCHLHLVPKGNLKVDRLSLEEVQKKIIERFLDY